VATLLGTGDVAPLGGGGIDEQTLAWPKRGHSPGARRRQWRPRVVVVVVGGGGGGEKRGDGHNV